MIGIPLSVTYEQKVYMFYIISTPSKKNASIEIRLEGKNYTFILNDKQVWTENAKDGESLLENGLAQKIVRAFLLNFHN